MYIPSPDVFKSYLAVFIARYYTAEEDLIAIPQPPPHINTYTVAGIYVRIIICTSDDGGYCHRCITLIMRIQGDLPSVLDSLFFLR